MISGAALGRAELVYRSEESPYPQFMRAVVVSDESTLHQSLSAALREAFGGIEIAVARTLDAALAEVTRAGRTDLLILDIGLDGAQGIDALVRLREKLPRCRTLATSNVHDRALILAALRAGAVGFLPRSSSLNVMVAALRLVGAGGKYLPPELLSEPGHPIRVPVTARQRDVLRLLLKGYSNQRIAIELSISESTVKQHAHAVFDALGVSTRAQLIAAAARGGIAAD